MSTPQTHEEAVGEGRAAGLKYSHETDEWYLPKKKKKVAKKMSPLGKLKAMANDKPTSLAGQLAWFKKHGLPKHPKHP